MGIISFFIGIVVLVTVLKIISLPFRIIIKFVINSLLAGLVIVILSYFGIVVLLSPLIIILSALLGIPGLVIGLIISMFI